MYCTLLYIDYLNYKRYRNESASTLHSIYSSETDPLNACLYFNPNCILQLIIEYICTEAKINIRGDNYDFCDSSGHLLNIRDYKPTSSGLGIFRQKETYFIVMLSKNLTLNTIEEIEPLLNPNSDIYEILTKNLKEKHFLKKVSSTTLKVFFHSCYILNLDFRKEQLVANSIFLKKAPPHILQEVKGGPVQTFNSYKFI